MARDAALCAAIALVVLDLVLVGAPYCGLAGAVAVSLKITFGAVLALTFLRVGLQMVVHEAPWRGPRILRRPYGLYLAAGAVVVLVAVLWKAPTRLVVNIVGLFLVAGPTWWMIHRRAGLDAAALATAALAWAVCFAAVQDLRVTPALRVASPNGAYRWTAGWPNAVSILAHEIDLDRPWPWASAVLTVQRYGAYDGTSHVLVRANDFELGPMRAGDADALEADVPGIALRDRPIRFELRQDKADAKLRLVAHRWTAGASLRAHASSYFDGFGWNEGTFDAAIGQTKPGIYVLELRPPR